MDVQRFDEIHGSGDKPSLEQRTQLSGQIQLHFSDRTKREAVDTIKQYLHQLSQGGGYSKGLQALTYGLVVDATHDWC